MTIKRTLALSAAIAAISLSAIAADAPSASQGATPPRGGPQAGMRQSDGIPERITRAEVIKRATDQFDAVDTNKDGVVTREEILAFQEGIRRTMGAQGGPGERPGAGPADFHGGPKGKGLGEHPKPPAGPRPDGEPTPPPAK